jgi:hypothetical protein
VARCFGIQRESTKPLLLLDDTCFKSHRLMDGIVIMQRRNRIAPGGILFHVLTRGSVGSDDSTNIFGSCHLDFTVLAWRQA